MRECCMGGRGEALPINVGMIKRDKLRLRNIFGMGPCDKLSLCVEGREYLSRLTSMFFHSKQVLRTSWGISVGKGLAMCQ